jgi:putative thioredoxin
MDAPNEHIFDISMDEFPQAVLQRSREVPVVVDFWAEWCGPCKVLSPLLEKVTAEANGAFDLVKIDVDSNQQLAAEFGVQGIPTVVAFRDGAAVSRFTGALPESQLRAWIDGFLPTRLDGIVDEARDAALSGDTATAERLFRDVLAEDPAHSDAGTGLASLMIAAGDHEDALIVLGRLTPTPDVERLQAAARLSASRTDDVPELETRLERDPTDDAARLDLARSLAASAEFEPALDHMLVVVRAKGEMADEARQAMLDIFGVLGDDHPLTATYRRQLTNALF